MKEDFYRAFEDKFRGNRNDILSRLDAYRPFVQAVSEIYPADPCLDIGCGRGEWLEYIASYGLQGTGIDLDQGMLDACLEINLHALHGDGIAYLTRLDANSLAMVSAFHVVEHISFDQLNTLISEALRVLKPGGILIMETPNPENIQVATCGFHMDPTHNHPIPCDLLAFLPEYHGFGRSKVIRLQESKTLQENPSPSLLEVLGGVSPDYGVIAQKNAQAHLYRALNGAFDLDLGLGLYTLTTRYDQTIQIRLNQAEQRILEAEIKARDAWAEALDAQSRSQDAVNKAEDAQGAAGRAAEASQELEHTLAQIYSSQSWALTRPIRFLGRQWRLLREEGLNRSIKRVTRKVGMPAAIIFLEICDNYPKVQSIIRRLHLEFGLPDLLTYLDARIRPKAPLVYAEHKTCLSLSPRAKLVFEALSRSYNVQDGGNH